MNNEQGSLENRFQNHQPQPNPAVWQALEKELKAKRRRRVLLWLVAACFLLFTTATVTWFAFIPHSTPQLAHVEPIPSHPQTDGNQAVHTNKLPQHTQTDTKPQQPGSPENLAKTNENKPGVAKTKAINPPQTKYGDEEGAMDFGKKAMQKNQILAAEPAGGHLKEPIGTSTSTKERTQKKKLHPLNLLAAKDKNTRRQLQNTNTSQAENGEKHAHGLSQKQPTAAVDETLNHEQATDENAISQNRVKPTDITTGDEKAGDNQLQKQENLEAPGTLTKPDSLLKADAAVLTVGDTAKKIVTSDSIEQKAKSRFTLAVFGNVKYAAVRRFQLNEVASERRISLADNASLHGQRMGYDLGARAMYQIIPWLGADFSLAVSYLQEQVNVRIKGTEVEGYELSVSAQELQVKSRFANHNAVVSAKSWATTGALCLRLKPSSFGFTLRAGVGVSWLFSTNYTTVSENGEKTDRTENPALNTAPLFYYAGLEKEITTRKGILIIEPNVQYFTKPTFTYPRNLKSTPVYFGLQFGWKW